VKRSERGNSVKGKSPKPQGKGNKKGRGEGALQGLKPKKSLKDLGKED